jgi:hypothetical protein
MISKSQCRQYVGKWVRFQTPYGHHVGIVERVTPDAMMVLSPRQYVPRQVASQAVSDVDRPDLALAWWGMPGGAYGAPGYGGLGFGWARWAVSFLIIYALWGLLWW